MPEPKKRTSSIKVSTGNLSGKGAAVPTTQKEVDRQKSEQKKINAEKKKSVMNRHKSFAKGRERRTNEVKHRQEIAAYDHETDMGAENYDTTNATTCGVRGNSPVKTAARKVGRIFK